MVSLMVVKDANQAISIRLECLTREVVHAEVKH